MNFIYDILVNFNENLYDFYDWNDSDNINHIRKIPLFRVESEVLKNFIDYNVKIDSEFLKKIENRAERFTSRDIEKVPYALLLSDFKEVFALKFNRHGLNIQISKLLVDEQEEVIDVCKRCEISNLKYEIIDKKERYDFNTRMEIENRNYLLNALDTLIKNNETEKLKYLYFECFGKKNNSVISVIEELKAKVDNKAIKKTMFEFFKLIKNV